MRAKLKLQLIGILFIFSINFSAYAQTRITTLDLINLIIKHEITEEVAKLTTGGQQLCMLNGRQSFECPSHTTLAQGICLANNRPSYECSSHISLGQAVCLNGGRPSYECSSHISLGQALCLNGGRPSYECSSSISVTTGVCLSTGRASYECSSSIGLPQAICLARGQESYNCHSHMSMAHALSLPVLDVAWAWDRFLDQYGSHRWACRGKNTGKFAETSRCNREPKNDTVWPGDRL